MEYLAFFVLLVVHQVSGDTAELLEALKIVSPALHSLPGLLENGVILQNFTYTGGNLVFSPEDSQCVEDLYTIAKGVTKLDTWALKMVDSASKIPSGILTGNIEDLGQFDECVEVSTPNFVGQHCLVTIGIAMKSSGIYSLLTGLTVAQCLPSSCSVSTINTILAAASKPFQHIVPGVNLTFSVKETDCHTNYKPAWDTSDWIMLCICCCFAILALGSAFVDYSFLEDKKDLSKVEAIIKSCSLYTNGRKLFDTKPIKGELSAINGVKFFSMAWVILGHSLGFYVSIPSVNLIKVLDWVKDWTQMLILNGTLSVDTFFVVSGLLNAYGFFALMERQKKYNLTHVLMSYLHRFIRLTPPFMVMVGFTATLLYRIGDGPLWTRMVKPPRDQCRTYWWYDLLYITDYKSYCMDQAWYLGADMQMFWLSPILLYPLWRWTVFGLIWFFVIFLGSVSIPFALSYSYGIHKPTKLVPGPGDNPWAPQIIYLPAHARLSTYIVGIMAGYLIYQIRAGKIYFQPRKIIAFLGWMVAGVFLLYPIYGGYWFYQTNSPYGQLADSFYIALFRPMFGIGVAWVMLACVTGYGGIVNSILSLGIFRPLGRLTYCCYLTHMAILKIWAGITRSVIHLDDYNLVQNFFGILFYGLCTGAVLSLLVEAPTMNLEKIFLGNLRAQSGNNARQKSLRAVQ